MTGLPIRTLGRTKLDVTVLGYGAMELRGNPSGRTRGRPITGEQANVVLNAVLDAGINYIDTSIDYGTSEEFIGEYISNRRDEYFLASKCGCVVGGVDEGFGVPQPHKFDRKTVTDGVEQSLRRMKTDYLDLIQFHQSPSRDDLESEGALQALLDLQEQGKVRFVGSSSTLPNIVDHIDMGVFDVFQIPYSGLERRHEQIISKAAQAGAGIVIRGGVAKGRPGWGNAQRADWDALAQANLDDLLDGASEAEFLLRFTTMHPDMTTTIVGTMNVDHLATNVAAATKGPLPSDIYEEAKERFAAIGSTPE